MLRLKINVLQALKDNGYTTYVIRKKNFLSETAMGHLRRGEVPDIKSLGAICSMLRARPEDIVENVLTDDEKIKYFI